jgi:archaellum component FlaG (FlaF/FlaG flagellin family)
MAYSCDSKTGNITLTISNTGNTRIEEDEIKIYVNDQYEGTFGKAIDHGTLSKNTVQGNIGQDIVKAVAPSNSVRIVFWC